MYVAQENMIMYDIQYYKNKGYYKGIICTYIYNWLDFIL